MAATMDDLQVMLQRAHSVADSADGLSVALASGRHTMIDMAVDDVTDAYESYRGRARTMSGRLGFDGIARQPSSVERDQGAATALATALVDLQMAVVLGQSAQAAGEIAGGAQAADVSSAVAALNETLRALQAPSSVGATTTRYSFDAQATPPPAAAGSPDIDTAKSNYEKQSKTVYDALLGETVGLLTEAFTKASQLNSDQVLDGLRALGAPLQVTGASKLVQAALEATTRAIDTLKGMLGPEAFGQIDQRIRDALDRIKTDGGAFQPFLKYSYQYDEGQKIIAGWLAASPSDRAKIDGGTKALVDLNQEIAQTYALLKRLVTTTRFLTSPLELILKKVSGTALLDVILGGIYLLAMDVAILRGMDYADCTKIVKFVDGVKIISKRALE